VGNYRLYRLDEANKVVSAKWIEAEDDDSAIAAATEDQDCEAWELWQGRRLVVRRAHDSSG
jgi:hypothetical protein